MFISNIVFNDPYFVTSERYISDNDERMSVRGENRKVVIDKHFEKKYWGDDLNDKSYIEYMSKIKNNTKICCLNNNNQELELIFVEDHVCNITLKNFENVACITILLKEGMSITKFKIIDSSIGSLYLNANDFLDNVHVDITSKNTHIGNVGVNEDFLKKYETRSILKNNVLKRNIVITEK